jgi:hypothetical protein
LAALEELKKREEVHTTVDASTWVISRAPSELPALTQPETQSRTPKKADTKLVSDQILSWMQRMHRVPGEQRSRTKWELASALQMPTVDILDALDDLVARGLVHRLPDTEAWALTPPVDEKRSKMPLQTQDIVEIARAQRMKLGRASTVDRSPIDTTDETAMQEPAITTQKIDTDPYNEPPRFNSELEWTPQFDIYSEDIWNYVSFPLHPLGKRWTRIDKRIVDSEVLDGFVFEVLEYYVLVREELSMEQIHDLVEMTRTRRMKLGRSKTVDRSVIDDTDGTVMQDTPTASSVTQPSESLTETVHPASHQR